MICKVEIFLTPHSGNTKAIANITGKSLVIKGFRVVQRNDGSGVFVTEPSQKTGEKYHPLIEFLDRNTKDAIFELVMKEYLRKTEAQQGSNTVWNDLGF